MAWFRLVDSFDTHPRVLAAGNEAVGLYVRCGCWLTCFQGGEFVPQLVGERYGSAAAAESLVRSGLWQRARGGWRMPRSLASVPGAAPRPIWSAERDDYRRKIPGHVRDLVMGRGSNQCAECGATEDLTLDHVRPWSLGGQDTPENLRVLCRPCNSSKGARVLCHGSGSMTSTRFTAR